MTTTSRRLVVPVLLVGTSIGLTACATHTAPTTTSSQVVTDLAKLENDAKAEGSVNVYISADYSYIIDGFKTAYPWATVNVTNGGSSDLAQKWLTEAQTGIANVDIGFIQPLASHELETLGALSQVQVPNDSMVPEQLRGSPYAHSVNQQPIVIGYNTNLVTDPPKTLADLADPKWRGKLILDDPALNSITAWVLASTRAKWGDAQWSQWVDGIAANEPIFTNNAGDSYSTVLQGTRQVCLCTYGDFLSQDPSTPMTPVFYTDPNGSLAYSIVGSISATAPHPNMAALLMNYVLDPTGGQKAFADHHRIPAVPVAGAATKLPDGVTTVNVMTLIQDYIDNPDRYSAEFSKLEP